MPGKASSQERAPRLPPSFCRKTLNYQNASIIILHFTYADFVVYYHPLCGCGREIEIYRMGSNDYEQNFGNRRPGRPRADLP